MWNHRLVREESDPLIVRVREVYYDEEGKPWSLGSAEAYYSDDWGEIEAPAKSIADQLRDMLSACEMPILEYPKDFTGKSPAF